MSSEFWWTVKQQHVDLAHGKNWQGSIKLPLQEDYKSWCFECEPLAINFAGCLTLKHPLQ